MPKEHNQCFDVYAPLSAVRRCIDDGHDVLVILRGVPGCGKSYLARSLCVPGGIIVSTDDLFHKNGVYEFEQEKLGEYHKKTQLKARSAMEDSIKPVIIDNTNISVMDFKPYITYAVKHCYEIYIVEPDNVWKYKAGQCAKRNEHGVPKEKIEAMLDLLQSDGRPPFHKLVPKDVTVKVEMPEVIEEEDMKVSSQVVQSTKSPHLSLTDKRIGTQPVKPFSLAPVPAAVIEHKVRDIGTQANDIGILLSTLGREDNQLGCSFYSGAEYIKQCTEESRKLIRTCERPAPFSSESLVLPNNEDHWLDFLHCIFPLVKCDELLHLFQSYGLQNTVDILFERREHYIPSENIESGSFNYNYQQTLGYSSCSPRSHVPNGFVDLRDSKVIDEFPDPMDELLTVDVSSLKLVLDGEFGAPFPHLIKLPRSVIQSIIDKAEFFSEENLAAEQQEQDEAYAKFLHAEEQKDQERQRISEQTARLFPEARHEKYVGYYSTVNVSGNPENHRQINKKEQTEAKLTLVDAQEEAKALIIQADVLDKQIRELQMKIHEVNKRNPAASTCHRLQLSKLVKKKTTLRDNADSLIRDANKDHPSFIDLHFMSLEGARKFVREQVQAKCNHRGKLRIVTGHGNGASVIKKEVLNDIKNMSQNNKWIIDSSKNDGETTITFRE